MSDGHRGALRVLSKSQTAAHREVQRARVLQLAADGVANSRIAAIEDYLTTHNDEPRPLVWTTTADSCLEKSPADASLSKKSAKTEADH